MTNIVLYNPEVHKEQLKQWYKDWKLSPNVVEYLPKIGVIAEEVCAVFLYQTDAPVCFVDNFISNKFADKEIKDKCLDQISEIICHIAAEQGYKFVMASTRQKAVVERSARHNWAEIGKNYTCIMRRL